STDDIVALGMVGGLFFFYHHRSKNRTHCSLGTD
ncbi:hypothetical protein LTSEJOH_2708, partial [Salmonella enterica subsp. enterica serovar Johannesburg str. S5-703]